ncbi:amidase [Methyloligella sp. 2.7D]|uniref:amidase n=1 Tax=unclassified Methyloligella TaxID=2625955 RepID=UPI00157DAF97|nr:amidase [Methyloligella sp. GL2]QKP76420.1 amidase [Methyloligella sp. GL2]
MTAAPSNDPVHALVPHSLDVPLRGKAQGPLAGLNFTVKDLFAIEGHKRSNGNADFYQAAAPDTTTAPIIRRLLDEGASLTGITICDEFFYSLLGTNAHYGNPENPNAPGRLAGGSSCGAAASVAAKMCDFALATDTGGSVRIPASFCGLYGFRPTHGRIALEGATLLAPSYDTAGLFTRDAALMAKVARLLLEGETVEAAPSRLLIAQDLFAAADPWIEEASAEALLGLGDVLPLPEPIVLASDEIETWREAFRIVQGGEIQNTVLTVIREQKLRLDSGIKERFDMAEAITPSEIAWAETIRDEARIRMTELCTPGTLIALPTAPTLPQPDTAEDGEETQTYRERTLEFTCPAGHAGLPQISLPLGEAQDCPVGLSLIGWAGGDEALLDLAKRLQAAFG